MPTSNWGIVTPSGADAANVPISFDAMADSLEGKIARYSATVATRATATSAHLADHAGSTGMVAYVNDRGFCVYDGNARSGSGGWSWVGQPVTLVEHSFSGTASSGTWVDLGTAQTVNLGSFNRKVRVTEFVQLWNASNTVVGTTKADCMVWRNSAATNTRAMAYILPNGSGAGQVSDGGDVYVSATWDYVLSGTSTFQARLRREAGVSGSVSASGTFQVIDLGPSD